MKPLALDLFCGGGGTCYGLQQAGFDVVGIDINPSPNYPSELIVADLSTGRLPVDPRAFDFIIASPPCQLFSVSTKCRSDALNKHVNLIPQTREMLEGHPFTCIENVPQAPIRPDLTLWGPQVGLGPTEKRDGIWRKRVFELSFLCWSLPKPKMERGRYITVTTSMCSNSHFYRRKAEGKSGRPCLTFVRYVMGIPLNAKMTYREIGEAVPPPYAKYIAEQAMQQIKAVRFTHAA